MSDDRVADALVWLEFAQEDLEACRSTPGRHWRPRHVANLAQQAAEKALKAAVVLSDQTPPATSFVDRVSLELMARDGITAALALDPDLAQSGVTVLPPAPADDVVKAGEP